MQNIKLHSIKDVYKYASLIFLFFFMCANGYSQYWERFYGVEDNNEMIFDIEETYDKGYLITALDELESSPSLYRFVSLLKTDINGDILWKRTIVKNAIYSRGCKPLSDGSSVCVSGYWDTENEMWNLMVFRIDACGNKLWCKQYIDSLNQGFQSSDIEIINNKIIFVIDRIRNNAEEDPFTLIMLSLDGNTLSEKPFVLRADYPLMSTLR